MLLRAPATVLTHCSRSLQAVLEVWRHGAHHGLDASGLQLPGHVEHTQRFGLLGVGPKGHRTTGQRCKQLTMCRRRVSGARRPLKLTFRYGGDGQRLAGGTRLPPSRLQWTGLRWGARRCLSRLRVAPGVPHDHRGLPGSEAGGDAEQPPSGQPPEQPRPASRALHRRRVGQPPSQAGPGRALRGFDRARQPWRAPLPARMRALLLR